jgi:hypothetical protein
MKKISLQKKYLVIPLLIFFLLPGLVSATGLVPCGPGTGEPCTVCHFLVLIKNIIDFLTEVAFGLVAVMILYGALLFFLAGGQEQKIRQGREVITTAVYGLAIVLLSWIIINTLIQIFVNPGVLQGPWNEIECPTS